MFLIKIYELDSGSEHYVNYSKISSFSVIKDKSGLVLYALMDNNQEVALAHSRKGDDYDFFHDLVLEIFNTTFLDEPPSIIEIQDLFPAKKDG